MLKKKLFSWLCVAACLGIALPAAASEVGTCALKSLTDREACLEKVYQDADKKMNHVYQQLMVSPSLEFPENAKYIRLEQRNWLERRDQLCGTLEQVKQGEDRAAVLTCLTQETSKQTHVLTRKLPVSDQCLNRAQVHDLACLKKLYAQEDKRLNTTYQTLMKHAEMDAQTKERILLEQRAWLGFRGHRCNVDEDVQPVDGTPEVDILTCLANVTTDQTRTLEGVYFSYGWATLPYARKTV